MPNQRKKLQKKKSREKKAKRKVLARRESLREIAKLEKEADKLAWDNRDRIIPIRNPKKNKKV